MRNGRHAHFSRRRNHRPLALILSLVLVLGLVIGGTVAYLVTKTNSVNNTFTPTDVNCKVNPTSGGITVENTGSIDAWIRVYVTANYVNSAENVCAAHSVKVSITGEDWTGENGIYYYNKLVPAGKPTSKLSISVPENTTDECTLKIEAFASAIQTGTDAVNAWKGGSGS